MARRKKNDQAAVLLLALPWQASAVLGGLAFVALRWLFPLVMKGNMFLPIMMPLARLASWLAVFLFAILTLGSYIRAILDITSYSLTKAATWIKATC